MEQWQEISRISKRKTHILPRTWDMDKYSQAPTLKPYTKVTIFDQDGPGVITHLHVSDYCDDDDQALVIRVWYDLETSPSIEMPLMDLWEDIEPAAGYYQTIFISHVRESHNFRLPLPFRLHIRIEVENPTSSNFTGYVELQMDGVDQIPADCGYLRTAYLNGQFFFPHEELTLCDLHGAGSIAAHWLQLEADHPACANGQGTCEANHEIYLDGQLRGESLGVEDFFTAIPGALQAWNRTVTPLSSAATGCLEVGRGRCCCASARATGSHSGSPAGSC
jgi:hypothetical protein